jgi:hypothetical protein
LFDFDDLNFDILDEPHLSQADLTKMAHAVENADTSKERVAVVLARSEGINLTCAQLREMVGMCSSLPHKKHLIRQRYAQLVDKDNFSPEVFDGMVHPKRSQKQGKKRHSGGSKKASADGGK